MAKRIKVMIYTLMVLILFVPLEVNAGDSRNVKDQLKYLSNSEIDELQGKLDDLADDHNLDVVVVIEDQMEGKSSRDYADDYYDYNGYGFDAQHSGLLMLINMEDREVWISTTGKAIDIFTDSRISNMLDDITPYISDGDYKGACDTFIRYVNKYAPLGSYFGKVLNKIKSGLTYIIALVIAVVLTVIITFTSKGKVTVTNRTYEGAFNMTDTQDIFIREYTTKTKIPKSSSSGGSSTHRGSSGRSHGGGGRSF